LMLGVFQTTKWATRFNYAKSTRSRYGTRKFCFCLNTRKLFAACWTWWAFWWRVRVRRRWRPNPLYWLYWIHLYSL